MLTSMMSHENIGPLFKCLTVTTDLIIVKFINKLQHLWSIVMLLLTRQRDENWSFETSTSID